jgi:hypothetical protein
MGRVICMVAFGRYRGKEVCIGLFGETLVKEAIWKDWA